MMLRPYLIHTSPKTFSKVYFRVEGLSISHCLKTYCASKRNYNVEMDCFVCHTLLFDVQLCGASLNAFSSMRGGGGGGEHSQHQQHTHTQRGQRVCCDLNGR